MNAITSRGAKDWLSTSRVPQSGISLGVDDPTVRTAWDALELAKGEVDGHVRLDFCGALVKYEHYGDLESQYGWTVRVTTRFDWRRLRVIRHWRACHVRNGQEGHFLVCSVTHRGAENVEWDTSAPNVFFPRN